MTWFKVNAFCPTGEGGGIDPTCSPAGSGGTGSVRDAISGLTRTPAVKSAINEIERGPLSYVISKSPKEALEEVSKVRSLHKKELSHLKDVAAGKAEPQGIHTSFWRGAEAKSGKVIPAFEWAAKLGVPQKESYLAEIDRTEKAIKFLVKRSSKKKTENWRRVNVL